MLHFYDNEHDLSATYFAFHDFQAPVLFFSLTNGQAPD